MLPTVTIQATTDIFLNTATGNGTITDTGNGFCTKRGFVLSLTSHADPGNVAPASTAYKIYFESVGSFGASAFTKAITGLSIFTPYYIRAYAYSASGYSYSAQVTFQTLPSMSQGTWGLMPKSQIESETIEQAIERIIAQHNADEEAHLGTGESLQSHKASEIIDHLASSIIEDKIGDGEVSLQKLTATHRIVISAFESLDGFNKGGTVLAELGSLTLATSDVANTYAYATTTPSAVNGLNWAKDFFWQATIKINGTSDQQIFFGVGGSAYVGGYSGAGFKISNGTLYCYHWDLVLGVETYVTHEITGITITDLHVYRIIYDQSAGLLSFYIDGVLKYSFNADLPTDNSDESTIFEIKTTKNDKAYMYAFDLLISVPK